jgi:DNA-binding response OmpR family regulator
MSNTMESSVLRADLPRTRVPTVYFIDDSATMREVIKIAFRRENIDVITCPDAATALSQFEQTPPDAVITDVIMPDKDGYEVCQHLKQDPRYSHIPVILMSGVVNKSVAEKAISVKADELIRKPFQPQELIGRVRALLQSKGSESPDATELRIAKPLSSIFPPAAQDHSANQHPGAEQHSTQQHHPATQEQPGALPAQMASPLAVPGEFAWPRALAEAMVKQPEAKSAQRPSSSAHSAPDAARSSAAGQADVQRLRNEILRLELLVKKLQTELMIEKQYCAALELHIRTLQES